MIDLTLGEIRQLSTKKKRDLAQQLCEEQGSSFVPGEFNETGLPTIVHRESGIVFVFLPQGSFVFGMSAEEERAARNIEAEPPITFSELRPAIEMNVAAFLISRTPISIEQARQLGVDAKPTPGKPSSQVAWIDYGSAARAAQVLGASVPSELQWEYACRGGTSTLFCWGDDLLAPEPLGGWMSWDTLDRRATNGFGLSTLFTGEWSSDHWRENHRPSTPRDAASQVVRGGGAFFWPWQGSGEWVSCMSSMRMPSRDLVDGRCAFRLCRSA